jgi:hypothetical protein
MKIFSMVFLTLMATVAVSAQTTDQNAFAGTWKLNVAKSKFNPGPALKSETVTIGQDDKVAVEEVLADGTNRNWSYTSVQGQEAPITGIDNSSVIAKVNGNTVQHTWKFNGGNFTGKGVLSSNGKVMTYTLDGTNPQGKHEHNVMVFDRQ